MWAGVQNVSRPIERCHEMSQMTPTFALVAATSAATTYHGGAAARVAARPAGRAVVVIELPVARPPGDQFLGAPLLEDLLDLLVRLVQGLLRAHPSRRRVGKHGRQDERVEDLALGGVGGSGVSDVRRPLVRRADRLELGRRVRAV